MWPHPLKWSLDADPGCARCRTGSPPCHPLAEVPAPTFLMECRQFYRPGSAAEAKKVWGCPGDARYTSIPPPSHGLRLQRRSLDTNSSAGRTPEIAGVSAEPATPRLRGNAGDWLRALRWVTSGRGGTAPRWNFRQSGHHRRSICTCAHLFWITWSVRGLITVVEKQRQKRASSIQRCCRQVENLLPGDTGSAGIPGCTLEISHMALANNMIICVLFTTF